MSTNEQSIIQSQGQSLELRDPSAIAMAEAAKARIQAGYLMALKKPRNLEASRQAILSACKRPRFAEKVEYTKPVGGSKIKGPSIRFAELALREFQNISSDVQIIFEDDKARKLAVILTDLETNASFSKQVSIQKTVERKNATGREVIGHRINTQNERVFIVVATEDELQTKEAATISKVLRNEGLRLIPQDIVEEAIEVARATMRAEIKKDPEGEKRRVIDGFNEIGAKVADLEYYLHKPITNPLSEEEMEDLRAVYRALKDGDAKWADYFSKETPQVVNTKEEQISARLGIATEPTPATPAEPVQSAAPADPASVDPPAGTGRQRKL